MHYSEQEEFEFLIGTTYTRLDFAYSLDYLREVINRMDNKVRLMNPDDPNHKKFWLEIGKKVDEFRSELQDRI